MSDSLYKTVRISAVSLVRQGDEWHILGYPDDWNLANGHPYTIAIKTTHEEAVATLNRYQERLADPVDGRRKTFARGVKRHLYEFLLP